VKRKGVVVLALVVALAAYAAYRVRASGAPFQWSGTVEADTIDVGSRVGGRVLEIQAREGDVVAAGQALVTLEKGDLPAQRLIAVGQLEQAQAALARVYSRTVPTARRAEIAQARARVEAQEATLEKAKLDERRARKLFAGGAATRVDVDNAATGLRGASAQATALRAQLETLLHGTPADVRSAQGLVDAAQGRVQQIDVMLGELVIRSPRAARIESLRLRPGDILPPNASAAKLLEATQLYVRIYVPETQIGRVHPGMAVPIYVDSFPRHAFSGRIESVAHEGEFTPRNLETADERADQVFASRVRIEDGGGVLRAGMAAFVRVKR
jgi:multidrug resistance efflux pump